MEIIPMLSEQLAEELVKINYGLKNFKISLYKSYSNQNFKVKEATTNSEYVLRVRSASERNNGHELVLQGHWLQEKLSNAGFNVPKPVPTVNGKNAFECIVKYSDNVDRKSTIEMVNFLSGSSIANTTFQDKDSYLKLCAKIGSYLGRMHKFCIELPRRDNHFEMENFVFYTQNTELIKPTISSIKDQELRKIIKTFLQNFQKNFSSKIQYLRKCFIHGDVSDGNVIITQQSDQSWNVSGLIDFEDVHYGYIVGDLGICTAYLMGKGSQVGVDALEVGKIAIKNYEAEIPLENSEKSVLLDCILARAVASYAMGQYLSSNNSEAGSESLSIQSTNFPNIIKLLFKTDRSVIYNSWF